MKTLSKHVGAALLAACLGATLAAPALADVEASGGWTRATPPGSKVAAGYLVLTNNNDTLRKLLTLTSPVSDNVMLHQSSIDSQGVARMWPVGGLRIEPGDTVRFEPNGRHVMFMDLKAPFTAGQKIPLVLHFEDEEPMTVLLEVQPLVPAAPAGEHAHH